MEILTLKGLNWLTDKINSDYEALNNRVQKEFREEQEQEKRILEKKHAEIRQRVERERREREMKQNGGTS